MSITKKDVEKVCRLARIAATDAEQEVLTGQLNGILKLAAQLDEVNTDGVEPLTSVIDMELPMRDDVVTDGAIPEKILANAPEQTAGFFVVPKVVE